MKTSTKLVKLAVFAGSKNNMKLHKVGYDTFRHTYLHHPDGDIQLIKSEKIKRTITANS
jgi:hypothetical protein